MMIMGPMMKTLRKQMMIPMMETLRKQMMIPMMDTVHKRVVIPMMDTVHKWMKAAINPLQRAVYKKFCKKTVCF